MTRLWYGFSGGDVIAASVADPDAAGGTVYAPATTTFDVFTTRTGSTQHTDLLDIGSSAITQVTPLAGRIIFQGLDGYTGSYWLQDTSNPTAPRWRVDPSDLAARLASTGFSVPAGGSAGQVLAKSSGTDGATGWVTPSSPSWSTLAGKPAVIAAGGDAPTARTAIGAASDSGVVHKTADESVAGVKTFSDGIIVPDNSIVASKVADFDGAVDDANQATSVAHYVLYNQGDPLPSSPGVPGWFAVQVAAPASPITITSLAAAASGADTASYSGGTGPSLSRAFAAGTFGLALIGIGHTSGGAQLPSSFTCGGFTWTLVPQTGGGNMSTILSSGNGAVGLYIGTGTPSGTSGTISLPATMHAAVWRIQEVANANPTMVQAKASGSITSANPSVALTATDPAHTEIGYLFQNSASDLTVGGGFTELGSLVTAPSAPPTLSAKVQTRADAVNSVGMTGGTTAQKAFMAVEIAHS